MWKKRKEKKKLSRGQGAGGGRNEKTSQPKREIPVANMLRLLTAVDGNNKNPA